MLSDHKMILKTGNAAIAAGNNEGFLEFCSEDTVWEFVGDKTLIGKQAVREWMTSEYIHPPKVSISTLVSDGDHLTAVGQVTTIDKDEKETVFDYCDVWEFIDNKIVGLRAFVIEHKNDV